jgi:hypothetical protein
MVLVVILIAAGVTTLSLVAPFGFLLDVGCPQDSKAGIGVSSALAARTGSKYSRRNAIFPPTARRNST